LPEELKNDSIAKTAYDNFWEVKIGEYDPKAIAAVGKPIDDPFDEIYIEALKKLRDVLLPG